MIATARESQELEVVAHRDRQIYVAAREVLSSSKYGALRSLNCSVHEGVVEISGTVSTFYLKQLAQTAMMQLNPSGHVRNLVEVNGETPVIIATNCQPTKQ